MNGQRNLTFFGLALCDLIVSLIIFNLVLCTVFVMSYLSSRGVNLSACQFDIQGNIDSLDCLKSIHASAQPLWLTIVNRSALASSAVLVLGSSLAVAWEMSRSHTGVRMTVHTPSPDYDGPERRFGPPDRREGNSP